MAKLFLKFGFYVIIVLLLLEVMVRIFHLHNDMPVRYVSQEGVYNWIPGQKGYTVYGNRRQKFSEYYINNSGYNSYREFNPTKEGVEVALIGDSYIEGFHQNYYHSIGKKIEDKLEDIQVYEYGHSSNDFADQLHLISLNKKAFDLIDHIIIGIKYENDFLRAEYKFIERKPFFPFLRKSKLVTYLLSIGFVDPIKEVNLKIRSLRKSKSPKDKIDSVKKVSINKDSVYLDNFKKLIDKYGFNKEKTTLLLDSRVTHKSFLNYLNDQKINFIDHAKSFENVGKRPTTLIYDHHWNNLGRSLVAEDIIEYLRNINLNGK